MKTLRIIGLGLLTIGFVSCSSHGIPSHGGGKRFYLEQRILSKAVDEAVAGLDFGKLKATLGAKPVRLVITAMGDAGGGTESGGGGTILSTIGDIFTGVAGGVGTARTGVPVQPPQQQRYTYGSFAFANARDIDYLTAVVSRRLREKGVKLDSVGEDGGYGGYIYVVVDEFGTDKDYFTAWVYSQTTLTAGVNLSAYFVPRGEGAPVKMGRGTSDKTFKEAFIFGFGPIGGTKDADDALGGSGE